MESPNPNPNPDLRQPQVPAQALPVCDLSKGVMLLDRVSALHVQLVEQRGEPCAAALPHLHVVRVRVRVRGWAPAARRGGCTVARLTVGRDEAAASAEQRKQQRAASAAAASARTASCSACGW